MIRFAWSRTPQWRQVRTERRGGYPVLFDAGQVDLFARAIALQRPSSCLVGQSWYARNSTPQRVERARYAARIREAMAETTARREAEDQALWEACKAETKRLLARAEQQAEQREAQRLEEERQARARQEAARAAKLARRQARKAEELRQLRESIRREVELEHARAAERNVPLVALSAKEVAHAMAGALAVETRGGSCRLKTCQGLAREAEEPLPAYVVRAYQAGHSYRCIGRQAQRSHERVRQVLWKTLRGQFFRWLVLSNPERFSVETVQRAARKVMTQ